MLTLALDTVTDRAGIALARDGEIVFRRTLNHKRHAADIVPAIREGVEGEGVWVRDISEIILADGPGSFTGIRIGVATVQGLLADHEIGFRTATSLKAQCHYGYTVCDGPVLAIYDALRGECFAAGYSFSDTHVIEVLAPMLGTPKEIMDAGREFPGNVVGPGVLVHRDAFQALGANVEDTCAEGEQLAESLLALRDLNGGLSRISDAGDFKPTYGRLAEAQARWEREHGRPLGSSKRQPG